MLVMKKILIIYLLLHSIIYAKDILLLHSYHKGYEWSDNISKAVKDNFKNSDVEITTEYMDTKRIYNDTYLLDLAKFYKSRYINRNFDLIIAVDDNALNFLENHADTIFPNIPIIFCGINNFSQKRFDTFKIKHRTTGVVEKVDIKKNIDLILKLHPNISKLMVLNDTTTTGQNMKEEFFKIYDEYKHKVEIEYIDKFEIEQLKYKVQSLDKDAVILFMLLFKDETGRVFTFKDGLQLVEKNTKSPIYGLWDFYLKHGLVGGFLTHGYAQGENASMLAHQILNGTNINNIAIIKKSPNRYIFNHDKLKEFNIDIRNLPQEAIIKNKPFDFYETYKKEIFTILIMFILCVLVIIILIILLIQKRKAKNQFQLQLKFIETLLNTIKNPIFYKDKNGHYVGGNEAFCEFIGKPKEEIVGKTMYDFFDGQEEFLKRHKEIEHKLLDGEEILEYTMEYKTPNGKIQTMLADKSLYYDLNGNVDGILTILHDITHLAQIEKEKKQNESFMAQQSKLAEIGEMISAIAHQWNEPLVEISAIVQDLQLQHQTGELTKKDIEAYVNDSMVQIQYMSKTLKDFRDFLKPSVQKSHFNIKDAFEEVLNILERQIKYSYINLNIFYNTDKLMVYGYKNEFMQVLITILNNAKDAILNVRSKDKEHHGKISISISANDDTISISIHDNGCGVRQIDKDKVFDPYYSTKSKGNGIGLYMSKILICEKMNGDIYFVDEEKQDDECTSLTIELPMDK
jgi:PAS domain S-box-containing protein